MIVEMNGIQFASGKYPPAKSFLTRIVEIVKKVEPDAKPFILKPISGDMGEIVVVVMFPSLAAYDEFLKNVDTDPEYEALVEEWREADWSPHRQVRLFNVVEE